MNADDLLRHGAFLRALARSLLGGDAEADDVVQEAYLRALRHRPRRPRAWLGKVVRNLALKSRRRGGRALRRERAAARPEAQPSAADCVARLEVERRVVEAVLALHEPYRSTVVQRYFDGLPTLEIARRTGVPYETVRTRLGRALADLRRRLDKQEPNWALTLAPIAGILAEPAGALSALTGVMAMSAKTKSLLIVLPLLGFLAGFGGHAAYMASGTRAPERTAPPGRRDATEGEVAELRATVESLRSENRMLREQIEAERPTAPPAGGAPDAIDWTGLVPLLRAVAAADPNRGAQLDAAHEKQLDDLIQACARHGFVRDGMQMQDLWRVPTVGGHVAFAFAREKDPALAAAVREEIEGALATAESALPDDPLEIELMAATEEQLAATEEILARRGSPALARGVAADVAPLWRRRHWQAIHVEAADLKDVVAGMIGELPEEAKGRMTGIAARMADEFKQVRAGLVRDHGEEAVRAVLLGPGRGGADEAVLARRREREDYPTVERKIRAAVARHQAAFERELYRSLPPEKQEEYTRVAATLMLFDAPK